jgi:uncharacterized protein (DUF486 family)
LPQIASPAGIAPVIMLTLSNVFMNFAWYGHLKYKSTALWIAILLSWGIGVLRVLPRSPGKPLR